MATRSLLGRVMAQSVHILLECFLVTARKGSCGKVMFLQVSVILFRGGWSWGVPGRGDGLVPGGCLLWRGVPAPGGSGLGAWWRPPPETRPPGRLLLRAVRILLECILVCFNFTLVPKFIGSGISL